MNSGGTPPPARERNRYGLRSVYADLPPQTADALFDKIAVTVRGSVRGRHADAVRDFIGRTGATAGPTGAPRLFGKGDWNGGYWQARPVAGGNTITGSIEARQRGAGARIDLHLSLNPIRTLEHFLRRYSPSELPNVPPIEFFRDVSDRSGSVPTLDRQDNMVSDFLQFAGSTRTGMVQRVATYLDRFETMLRARLLHELAPVARGYSWSDAEGDIIARNEDVELRLEWGKLAVTQCEVCWERRQENALLKMHHMADRALSAARDVTIQHHVEEGGASVSRELGALTVAIPMVPNRSIRLVAYAKAADRLRFEVRYSSITRHIRERLPAVRSLNSWLSVFAQDAAARIQWPSIVALLEPAPGTDVETLLDFMDALAVVTRRLPAMQRPLCGALLSQGGITCTGDEGTAPIALLRRLVRDGVIEHVRLVARDHVAGRRYRLTDKYAGLPRLFANTDQERAALDC